jgi:signal transduction histidine kinase/CheY-like chemotaxis protein
VEQRVLLLAPRGRDALVVHRLLTGQGHACVVCDDAAALARELPSGAGIAVVTEESLVDDQHAVLGRWLETQPPWSDFPFILLATKRSGRRPLEARRVLEQLGNVVVLERPVHSETLTSAVASALRGRKRQYQARQHLEALTRAEERLLNLNSTLETRIEQRTIELSLANNKLMQEVAERERAQAALAQAQKMEAVGQLTGGIAHDFNNLLTVIFGNLELIERRATDERTARLADYAKQAADRAAKLTHQLLAFSRTQRLSLEPVDINAMVLGMNDMLARTIGPRVRIEMDLDPQAPWAMADVNQLELAVLNLAINARDAMSNGGLLRIASATARTATAPLKPGDYAVITVSDTGEGIPEGLLQKVFDPFFTTKPIGKGTGLGLSQVYGIAQQSGGTVRIRSVEGKGSSVEIWLPVTGPVAAVDLDPATDRPDSDSPGERVLVIDDDPAVRRFVVDCLEGLGYQVDEAGAGEDGLRRLSEARPDLIIVDYAMPGMSGVDVVKQAQVLAPGLPVILATGYADMEAVDAVMEPDNVLRKPFRIDDLALAVRRALVVSRRA